jgi:hypothetical protein
MAYMVVDRVGLPPHCDRGIKPEHTELSSLRGRCSIVFVLAGWSESRVD